MKEKVIEIQPEVSNAENYPHILPPNDINVNTDIPIISEVLDARKKFKDGKCQGTDKIYGEELKYNNSHCFMLHLMLLLTTIWTTFILPSSWLISSIVNLKTRDREVMQPIIGVFPSCPLVRRLYYL